jgi:transposase
VGFGDRVDRIEDVAMDPYSGFNRAVQDHTTARVTMDRFHCVRLANQALTDVRCRRQQEICGHRGRKGDPLWRVRRDLLRARERLTPRASERIRQAFAADTDLDVECGWVLKETLRDIYADARDRDHAHRQLVDWYQLVADYDVAEFIRLARTLSQWEDQFLAYFETRLTNGRTEARNLVIKQVKRTGYGFTNFDNYRLRVLHRCS